MRRSLKTQQRDWPESQVEVDVFQASPDIGRLAPSDEPGRLPE
jgi:hypothetical protein